MNTLVARADFDADVLVAGAGPAGVTLALRLRRLGYDVLLASPKTPTLRNLHEFETFTPAVQDQLSRLGLRSALEAARRARLEFELRWGTDRFQARAPSDLIDRNAFLTGLRQCASDADIRVWDGRVESFRGTECGWSATLTSPEGPREVKTRSFADATGRRGICSRRLRRRPGLVAIHASWSGEHLPYKLRIAAGPRSWVWSAPANERRYVTTVFQDPREAKRDGQHLIEQMNSALLDAGTFSGASGLRLLGLTGVCDVTPQMKTAHEGREFFRVGDAALTIDPLSSSGVQAALQSALDTALAMHTLRVAPASANLVETFLRCRLERRRAHHEAWAAAFYRKGASQFSESFWTERARFEGSDTVEVGLQAITPLPLPEQLVALDSAVRIEQAPCAVGDLIELRSVVNHPNITAPVAFVEGIEVSNLLGRVARGSSAGSVVREWSRHVGKHSAVRVFSWAWRNRLILPSSARLPQTAYVLASPQLRR